MPGQLRVQQAGTCRPAYEVVRQDGFPLGTLSGYSIESDGEIVGEFDNGKEHVIGQFVLALVSNPETLIDEGDGVFSTGANTNNPVFITPSSR